MDKAATLWVLTATFTLKGVLAGDWSVDLPVNPICAVIGSTVVLPCSYDYPEDSSSQASVLAEQEANGTDGHTHRVLSEMWCLGSSRCITPSYVFHSAGIFLDPTYDQRVKYLGRPGSKNCSLQISGVRRSDGGAYVFYVITDHRSQKMPPQTGVVLLVTDSPDGVAASVSPCSPVLKGEAVRLSCCSPGAGPAPEYRWVTDQDQDQDRGQDRGHAGPVWTMNQAPAHASGTYFCQMHTAHGWRNSTGLTIDVQYPPHNTTVRLLTTGEETLVLSCSSDANPPVTYTWLRGPGCLPAADGAAPEAPATPLGTNRTLVTNATAGEYCCVATNDLGSHSHTLRLSGATANTQVSSKRMRWLIVGTTTVALLAVVGIIAFALRRRLKPPSVSQSYALTETTAPPP